MADVITILVLPTVTVGAMIVSLSINSSGTFFSSLHVTHIPSDAIAAFAAGLGVLNDNLLILEVMYGLMNLFQFSSFLVYLLADSKQ